MILSGVFGYEHIIFLVVVLALIITSCILLKKKQLDEKQVNLIMRIGGIIWLVFILANRISVTYTDVVINHREGYTWLNLIPNSFCGMSSLILSIVMIIGKRDNFVLHSIGYIGMIGGLVTMFYPDFLDSQSFLDIRSITGLLHHTIMFYMMLLAIVLNYMTPSIKKWYYLPLGMCFMTTIGVIEYDAFGFMKAMQIKEPFIKAFPILSSWYMTDLMMIVAYFVFIIIYEKKKNNCSLKEVFKMLKNN